MTGEADVDEDEVDDDDVKNQEKCFVYFGDVVKNKSSKNENDKILWSVIGRFFVTPWLHLQKIVSLFGLEKGFNAAFSVSQKPEKLIVPVFHQSFPLHINLLTGVFWQTFKGAQIWRRRFC